MPKGHPDKKAPKGGESDQTSKKVARDPVTGAPRRRLRRNRKLPKKAPEPLNISVNSGFKYTPGNRFWERRSSHGRKPIFKSPEALWNAATEYFQWSEDNPIMESKPVMVDGKPQLQEVPKHRMLTIQGLCIFLDISADTWANYKKYPDFVGTCIDIEEVIRQQQAMGAAAGQLNPMIVARIMGLKEAIDAKHSGTVEHSGSVEVEVTTSFDELTASELETVKGILLKAKARTSKDAPGS